MGRQLRSYRQSGWHHVTNRGIDRRAVFRTIDDRLDFGRLVASSCRDLGVSVFAYCLMDNHYHLVLSCPDGGLSAFMQHLSSKFTRHANDRHGGDGPIFRGRFFSRAIMSHEYLLNAVRYVHRNPLDIASVGLADYRWSSHRTYLGLRPAPEWLDRSTVLQWFDSEASFAAFVDADLDRSVTADVNGEDLISALEHAADELAPSLGRAPQGTFRTASYLAIGRVSASNGHDLVNRLSPSSAQALEQAIWRARRLDVDGTYSRVVTRALEMVAPTFKLCLTQLESQSQAGRVAS